jgi:hypothetical protein
MDNKLKDWKTMILISHDFYHQWRKAVEEKFGKDEADQLAVRFWELVGENTAASYLNKGKIDRDNLAQIVQGVARSSEIMGEVCEVKEDGNDILLIHTECPWIKSHEVNGVPGECQAGCDRWFQTAAKIVNPRFTVKTESCLANGESSCLRRFSVSSVN